MWREKESDVDRLLCKYKIPSDVTFSYGTAGFRTTGSHLAAVGLRMAYVCALRSILAGGKAVGIMITASHNPAGDNGIKMVEPDGSMLSVSWEPFATTIANTDTASALLTAIADFLSSTREDLSSLAGQCTSDVHACVHLARDTRPTGNDIAQAFHQGFASLGGNHVVVDHGWLTTPQLHTMVYLANIEGSAAPTAADYYHRLGAAFVSLLSSGSKMRKWRVTIDCANGIGAYALKGLLDAVPALAYALDLVLLNTDVGSPERLNHDCGADYVQKTRHVPPAFDEQRRQFPESLFFSIDGDADRVVAFHYVDDSRGWSLLDGDRIAILLTKLVDSLMGRRVSPQPDRSLDVGLVQTAYANGASTAYVREVLGLRTYCAATGVKHLHPIAHERDVGVYFEANGHGTILFDWDRLEVHLASSPEALESLSHLRRLLSQACGDAIGDLLACIVALHRMEWTSAEWLAMYDDLPSVQLKVCVPHPKRIACTADETRAVAPPGLQEKIDEVIRATNDTRARGFVRPSGTEPLVRVYAESSTAALTESLGNSLSDIVRKFCS